MRRDPQGRKTMSTRYIPLLIACAGDQQWDVSRRHRLPPLWIAPHVSSVGPDLGQENRSAIPAAIRSLMCRAENDGPRSMNDRLRRVKVRDGRPLPADEWNAVGCGRASAADE